jgi:hypothetical protein
MTRLFSANSASPGEPRATPRRSWLRRPRLLAPLAAVAVVAGAAGAAGATWQLDRAHQDQQISREQARLSSDVFQLDQNAMTLNPARFLSSELRTMQRALSAEMSAWAAQRQAGCPERSEGVGPVDRDAGAVVSGQISMQSVIQNLHGDLARVRHNVSAVKRDVAAIRSLGGQVVRSPSSAIYLGTKALRDTNQATRVLYNQGSAMAERATMIAREAQILSIKAHC